MTKGKPWTVEEEAKLKQLIEKGECALNIGNELGKDPHAIYQKAKRLGLKVVMTSRGKIITTSKIELPEELPSVEEALRILAGALKVASQSGLDRVEVQRLQVVATLASTYKELLADYIDYRGIEAKLVEMERKYAEVRRKLEEKPKGNAC